MDVRTIWKFPFEVEDFVRIGMPSGARPIACQVQNGTPTIWAEVDPGQPMVERTFSCFATGGSAPIVDGYHKFLATIQLGAFVAHVYSTPEESPSDRGRRLLEFLQEHGGFQKEKEEDK